jgi:aldehyde:ferredoxin oxidoreductase
MDATSVGSAIAFLMDCHEKGLLSHEDLEGVDPHFGNEKAIFTLVEKIAKREGIGEKIADGVKVAAEKIGKNSSELAMQIKGLELPGYDLRCLKTTALAAAVSFRGADHSRSGIYAVDIKGTVDRLKAEAGRGKIVKDHEDIYNVIDSLIVCKNAKGTFDEEFADMAKLYTAVTGLEISSKEMHLAGERVQALAKLINQREGLSRKDDSLPYKILNQPVTDDGLSKGAVVTKAELDLMLDDYYQARGYDKEGNVSEAKLKELGLEKTAKGI